MVVAAKAVDQAKSRSWIEPYHSSVWNPYYRSPLYTWWAAPWDHHHHSAHSIVQSHPLPHHPIDHRTISIPIHHPLPLHHAAGPIHEHGYHA